MMRRLATRLVQPRRGESAGGVALNFALLALPMAVLSFGLIDINRASSEKRRLQDALDAATLAAARSTAVTNADLQTVGAKSLTANLAAMSDATLQTSAFKNGEAATVVGDATAKVTPVIANLWLKGDMTIGAHSEVVRSMNKVEVVMVLDTTGSMQGSKLTNLKTASKNFVDTLSAAAARSVETNPVKIGIVPFSSAVRVTSNSQEANTYKNGSWIDVNGDNAASKELFNGQTVNRFNLLNQVDLSWGGCVEGRKAPYDVTEGPPTPSTPDTLYTPFFWPDESDTDDDPGNDYLDDGPNSIVNLLTWLLRQARIEKYNTDLNASTSSGPNKGCNMQPLMRLSTNWTSLKSRIDALNAAGETHIPLGLMWGWHLLSPSKPFGDGVAYNTPKTTKIVLLMTDGDNTYTDNGSNNRSNYDGYGFAWQGRTGTTSNSASTRETAIDNRLKLLCTNMKNAGIVIYTVRVEVTSGSSSLLQNCATKPDMFYDVQSASNLNAVFSAIAGSIENLRISK